MAGPIACIRCSPQSGFLPDGPNKREWQPRFRRLHGGRPTQRGTTPGPPCIAVAASGAQFPPSHPHARPCFRTEMDSPPTLCAWCLACRCTANFACFSPFSWISPRASHTSFWIGSLHMPFSVSPPFGRYDSLCGSHSKVVAVLAVTPTATSLSVSSLSFLLHSLPIARDAVHRATRSTLRSGHCCPGSA